MSVCQVHHDESGVCLSVCLSVSLCMYVSLCVSVCQGHHDEVWGLSVHPNQNQFVSVGYDKMLYLWDTLTRRSIWAMQLPVSGYISHIHTSPSWLCTTAVVRLIVINKSALPTTCKCVYSVILPIKVLHCGNAGIWIFDFCCSCDLVLDPMTVIYELSWEWTDLCTARRVKGQICPLMFNL